MSSGIPIYHVDIQFRGANKERSFLAYIRPQAALLKTSDLAKVFAHVDNELKKISQEEGVEYTTEQLSLYFLDRDQHKFILWKPDIDQDKFRKIEFHEGIIDSRSEANYLVPKLWEDNDELNIYWDHLK
ncbi:hypothetical protein V8Q18_06285 [Acinetobacter baumannii]